MTVRPSPDRPTDPADPTAANAVREAGRGRREPAVAPSEQARAGSAEGARPAAPAVDELGWWEKQLGVELDTPLDAA